MDNESIPGLPREWGYSFLSASLIRSDGLTVRTLYGESWAQTIRDAECRYGALGKSVSLADELAERERMMEVME